MSLIPFLKNKRNQGGAIPQTEMTRTPDSYKPDALIEGIADELMKAIDKKDFSGIKSALRAFLHIIKTRDTEQDQES